MNITERAIAFKKKYPKTIAWRVKKHAKIAQMHLGNDEEVLYVFTCQKNNSSFEIFRTFVVVLTNKRIIVAQKRLLFGYLLISITPDMYNDITVLMGLLWGKICLDTVKEEIILSNIQKEALKEIEANITEFVLKYKKDKE